MKQTILAGCAAVALGLAGSGGASAQNVVITNARIIDGTGKVIERGAVVAKDGRIVSVAAGEAPKGAAGTKIDAHGMTVMAAFIDAHRHLFQGAADAWLKDQSAPYMKSFVDAGFTTVFSMGDDPKILELKRRLNAGEIVGPTLYSALIVPLSQGFPQPAYPSPPSQYTDPGRTDPARPPNRPVKPLPAIPDEATRATIRQAKQAGYDAIKTILVTTPGGPETHTLNVIVDEAHKQGLRVFTHATAVEDTITAVNAHVDVLAHTPHIGHLEEETAAKDRILAEHIPMVSTLGVFIPHFDDQNRPLYRDGGPFPMPRPLESGGQGPVNARILWEGGQVYAYGTDTQWDPRVTLNDELRALNVVFSPRDIIKIMGPNAAAAIDKAKDLGTLEPGKKADIVLIDGDPLADILTLTRVAVTIKDGKVVADKRAKK
ncbi:MAG: amidohydrolase family protein [Caulobacteraceae bacterium]